MKKLLAIPAVLCAILIPFFVMTPVAAQVNIFETCDAEDAPDSPICESADEDDLQDVIGNIINALLFLIGIAAVIMIIIGGFMYVTAAGDSSKISTAKNTIFYAVIGLVVALAAYAIVSFVITQI